ncbi:hypothetical protein LLG10_02205 [bacterium]|nr:hypothetical protein [bacterium]
MNRFTPTKKVLPLFLCCMVCLSNCQKTNKMLNQENSEISKEPQAPIVDILLNKKDLKEEIHVEETQPPIEIDMPFSSPDLDITYKKFLNSEEYDFKNPEQGGYFFVPLQIRNNQFEYCVDENLVQLDLATHKETIHQDFFKNLSITAPLNIPGEWILADQNKYFFAESNPDGESIICKNADTLQIIWKTKLFRKTEKYSTYIDNKMLQNDQHIFIAFEDIFKCYCIEKKTGKIMWTYDLNSTFPYLIANDPTWDESSKASQSFHINHVFSNGIVVDFTSFIDQSKAPKEIAEDRIGKTITLSLDGRLVNILNSDVLLYDNDRYLSNTGYKSLIDNSVQWNMKESITGDSYFMKSHKKNYIKKYPYLYQANDKLFYIRENENISTISIYNQQNGKELWNQSFSDLNLKAVFEQNAHFYLFYEKENKGFILIIDPAQYTALTIPIGLNQIPVDFSIEYKMCNNQDRTNILFPSGLLSFTSQAGSYQPYLSKQESENYYITQNINEPYFFENHDYIVVSFTPQEHNRGGSRGGAILVLKKQ